MDVETVQTTMRNGTARAGSGHLLRPGRTRLTLFYVTLLMMTDDGFCDFPRFEIVEIVLGEV